MAQKVLPETLGELRSSDRYNQERLTGRTVKDELRQNLIDKLRQGEPLFPGVLGFEDTVLPQLINAVLSKHNFILLGLRGQAKTRLIRLLTTLLDSRLPYLAGSETRDNPYQPVSRQGRLMLEEFGEKAPIAWLAPQERYVEKLATPDVTIADMIGDLDPIKAARLGQNISDELTIHYGLLPRANRGIFAINELPDLAGKIQVGLFNIMQEGDIQIKGYPVRLPLDLLLVFTANPEDYTARGKIITPLKDRIGSEIRTHYPLTIEHGIDITRQESWTSRNGESITLRMPGYIREVVEQIAFLARDDKRVDRRSGVSQRMPITVLENVASNAERRALLSGEDVAVPRILDVYSALPAITGKLELEYEGELKGGDQVALELVRLAVGRTFDKHFQDVNLTPVVQWFELGGELSLGEGQRSDDLVGQLNGIQGLMENTRRLGLRSSEPDAVRVSAGEFILEGLHAHRRISRDEERRFAAERTAPDEGRKRQKRPGSLRDTTPYN